MALIPYEPFRHLDQMRRDLDRWFFGNIDIDVYETDREVVAVCNVPGLEKKEDVVIEVNDNVLSISGTVNKIHEIKENRMYRQERFAGRFQRSVGLPAHVSAEGVKASYKNGVLEIRMPKTQGTHRKRIDVEFH